MTGSMYCILTSGRINATPFGEESFALSLGGWLTKQNLNAVVIGSKIVGATVKYFSKVEISRDKTNDEKLSTVVYHPPYIIFMLSRLLFSLICFLKILSINRRTPIRLIHAQDTGYSGLSAVIAGKILKIPIIVSSHGIRHRSLASILTGKFGKILLKFEYNLDVFTTTNADCIISLNPEIKDYYEKLIGKPVEYIPNPIKLENFVFSSDHRYVIRKELGIDNKTKLIGFVGRLSTEKNISTLLESFAGVLQDNLLAKLIIVGTGPKELHLKEEIRKRHIENKVIFCGLRSDISRVLSALDIFVLPSYTEGLSGALLEAMSCGCAIICSDIPANRVLVRHYMEGLLFDPYNSLELKDAIHLLSTNDSLRSKLGDNAKIKVSQYDEEVVFPKILQLYLALFKKD